MAPLRRRRRSFLYLFLILLLGVLVYIFYLRPSTTTSASTSSITKTLVMARLSTDDTSWVKTHLPSFSLVAYTMDKPWTNPRIPVNKGREGMAYLTYIITHYYKLPDVIVFIHGQRYQWHNDDTYYDQVNVLKRLRLETVVKDGYVNLRCSWALGCPREILPNLPPGEEGGWSHPADKHYASAYRAIFGLDEGAYVPSHIGAGCCAQFAASRSQIHRRSKAEYVRIRQWLLDTTLSDMTAGRILEYTWHIIMGRPGVWCPVAERCYCDNFGMCGKGYGGEEEKDVKCTLGDCKLDGEWVYTLPKSRIIPDKWPDGVDEKVKEVWMFGEDGKSGDPREKELEEAEKKKNKPVMMEKDGL